MYVNHTPPLHFFTAFLPTFHSQYFSRLREKYKSPRMSKRKCPSPWQLPRHETSVPYIKGDVLYVNGKPFGPVDPHNPFHRQYINVPGSPTHFEEKYIIPNKRIRITPEEGAENIAPVDPLNILVKSETSTYCISRKIIKTENDISVTASSTNNTTTTVQVKTEVDVNTAAEAETEVEPPSHSRVSLEDYNDSSHSGGVLLSQVHSDVIVLDDEVSIPCDDIIIDSPSGPNDHRHRHRPADESNINETPSRRHRQRSVRTTYVHSYISPVPFNCSPFRVGFTVSLSRYLLP